MKTEQHLQQVVKVLTETAGPSGHEGPVRDAMRELIKPWTDELFTDRLGSLIAKRGKQGPRIMVAGHLDEIGFMVTKITKDGFLQFQTLGGWWSQVLPAQRVEILTRKGNYTGIIGSKPPHLMKAEERKKGVDIDSLFIDVAAENREEVEEMGIRPGDPIVPVSEFTTFHNENRWMGKAMDNRLGCAVVVELFRRLAETEHRNQVYGVGTVMEEVGVRGAKTSTSLIQPDIAIVIDVGIASDTPKIGELPSETKLGEGPALTLYDAGHIAHSGLSDLAQEVARDGSIPFQFEIIRGGATDAAAIHQIGQGVPTISLCIPARYIHSHAAIIDKRDVEHLVDWLVAMIAKLDREAVQQLQHV